MQTTMLSDSELRRQAFIILTKELGHLNTWRFISLLSAGKEDYLKLQEELFAGMTAKEIYMAAKQFWENKNILPTQTPDG